MGQLRYCPLLVKNLLKVPVPKVSAFSLHRFTVYKSRKLYVRITTFSSEKNNIRKGGNSRTNQQERGSVKIINTHAKICYSSFANKEDYTVHLLPNNLLLFTTFLLSTIFLLSLFHLWCADAAQRNTDTASVEYTKAEDNKTRMKLGPIRR